MISTYKAAKTGEILGSGFFYAGVAIDVYGLNNYLNNDPESYQVSPAKMGINTGMSALMWKGGLPGALIGGTYFAIDGYYPGGWEGAMNYNSNLIKGNQAIVPGWQLFPKE